MDVDWAAIVDESWRFALGVVLGVMVDSIKSVPGGIGKLIAKNNQKALAKSHETGTALRNLGARTHDPDEQEAWLQKEEKWRSKMLKQARRISVPRAQNVATLGLVRPITVSGMTNPDMLTRLGHMTLRLERLSTFLENIPDL